MNGHTASYATTAYRDAGIQHELQSASPHRIIQIMMQSVLARIAKAKGYMANGDIAEKGKCIGDAISIISGLQASLNHKPNAQLSGNFDALYDYMTRRLLEANFRNDDAGLTEVGDLMREIKSAWDAVGDRTAAQPE